MTMLVTRQQAADHLRIDDTTDEANDLDLKIQAASEVVLDYLEMAVDDFSDSDSDGEVEIPFQIQAAVLLLVGDMHRYRDSGAPTYNEAILPPAVRALLYPLKTFGLTDD
jgi:hypothetical protein